MKKLFLAACFFLAFLPRANATESDMFCPTGSGNNLWQPCGSTSNPVNTTALQPTNVTPADCSGTITSGGAAQNAFAAQTAMHGFCIKNIDASAGSGEPLWFSITGTAAAVTAGSYSLAPPAATSFSGAESFCSPPGLGSNIALSVIAATTGHKFSCTRW